MVFKKRELCPIPLSLCQQTNNLSLIKFPICYIPVIVIYPVYVSLKVNDNSCHNHFQSVQSLNNLRSEFSLLPICPTLLPVLIVYPVKSISFEINDKGCLFTSLSFVKNSIILNNICPIPSLVALIYHVNIVLNHRQDL